MDYILQQGQQFRNSIARLKTLAPTYPQIYTEKSGGDLWATSMVPFTCNDIRFLRHHVNTLRPLPGVEFSDVIKILQEHAELTQKHAIPCHLDDVVCLLPAAASAPIGVSTPKKLT